MRQTNIFNNIIINSNKDNNNDNDIINIIKNNNKNNNDNNNNIINIIKNNNNSNDNQNMNSWYLYSVLVTSGVPLTFGHSHFHTKKRERVEMNRILQTIEELSIVSCHSRCKLNSDCVSYAIVTMGEVNICYLLADRTSSSPLVGDPDDMLELDTVDIVPIKFIHAPSPSSNEFSKELGATISANIHVHQVATTPINSTKIPVYKILNDREFESNGHIYYFANKQKGKDAIKFCKDNNHGHVASLLNANEEDLLRYIRDKHYPAEKSCLWIGMKRDDNADKKYGTWLDG